MTEPGRRTSKPLSSPELRRVLLTRLPLAHDNVRLMSARDAESLDFNRAVQAGRWLEGSEDLSAFPRLSAAVVGLVGRVEYRIEFGSQAFGGGFMRVRGRAEVLLQCERSLESFAQRIEVDRHLAPTRSDQDEAALPAEWESLPLEEDGRVLPLARLEDELLLALPEFPRKPGSEEAPLQWESRDERDMGPFAALSSLRGRPQ